MNSLLSLQKHWVVHVVVKGHRKQSLDLEKLNRALTAPPVLKFLDPKLMASVWLTNNISLYLNNLPPQQKIPRLGQERRKKEDCIFLNQHTQMLSPFPNIFWYAALRHVLQTRSIYKRRQNSCWSDGFRLVVIYHCFLGLDISCYIYVELSMFCTIVIFR